MIQQSAILRLPFVVGLIRITGSTGFVKHIFKTFVKKTQKITVFFPFSKSASKKFASKGVTTPLRSYLECILRYLTAAELTEERYTKFAHFADS